MTKFARSSCCLMLALLLCLSFCSVGYATEVNSSLTPSQTSQLLSIVSDLEPQKSMLGLSNVDFNNLYLGEPIQTYIYTNDTFVKSHDLFPVLYNNTIVFWAYDNNGNIQISAGLSSKINSCGIGEKPFAIIYDANKAYAFSDNQFVLLATSNYTNTSRSVLNPHARSITPNLEMQSLSAKEKIQYIGKRSTAHRLNVNFVSQDLTYLGIPSSYICWAATAACIVNYCKGTSKTAVDVAKDYHGPADFNYSIVLSEMDDVLGQYSLTYTAKEQVPSERVVLENIDDGYPIASGWTYASGSKHFCTIYGTNPISGYHYVMDPDQGFLTAILGSSGYTYVSAVSGDTLTFYSAACHSW